MDSPKTYLPTFCTCYVAYVIQAVVNNLAPLLFVTFVSEYGLQLTQISLLIAFHFGVQLLTDLAAVRFVDRIGYRASALLSHGLAAAGLLGLGILPDLLPDPFSGILLAVFLYATGGGLIEVIVSPMVEARPTRRKAAAMSLLHSFYSWGQLAAVGLSTLYFAVAGLAAWRMLTLLWAVLPLLNGMAFLFVRIASPAPEASGAGEVRRLFGNRYFYLFLLLILCAGAAELTVCQWASAFLETGLGIPKATGDLLGVCLFSVFMGLSRVLYGLFSERLPLRNFLILSGILCVVSYLMLSLSANPYVVCGGCALCGFSVGIMWPGTYSMAARHLSGGTAMFAMLALSGDLGCVLGPALAGFAADAAGGRLSVGILVGLIFPLFLAVGYFLPALRGEKKTVPDQDAIQKSAAE